jgi:hypothetical protein
MKRLLKFFLGGLLSQPAVVAILVERGFIRGVMSPEEVEAMRQRVGAILKGRAEDPCVKVILELIEYRTLNAMAAVQFINHHSAGDGRIVSYRAGGAAELNDLLADIVNATQGKRLGPVQP